MGICYGKNYLILYKPFVDESHMLHRYFLKREYALKIPAILLVLGFTFILSFFSLLMIKSKKKKLN